MEQREWKLPDGSLHYGFRTAEGRKEAVITGLDGAVSLLEIPMRLEGCPVTVIGKKAFLSHKLLQRVILPSTLHTLEDWAFAYCDGLEEVSLPARHLSAGRAVFMECGNLKRIEVRGDDGPGKPGRVPPDVSELLAAALLFFEAYYLLDPLCAGDEEWLGKWDARLLSYLHTQDQEGYSRQVLCGEEDYGSTDLEGYLAKRRKSKVRICFLRLLNPLGLAPLVERELKEYLLAHTKGGAGEEAWEVVLEEHGEERRYYELFAGLDCLTEENFDGVMKDIGEKYPEMKAYFLKIKGERMGGGNFFDSLTLD